MNERQTISPVARNDAPSRIEREEWFESLDDIAYRHGLEAAERLLEDLAVRARSLGMRIDPSLQSPYVNTIRKADQPPPPDDLNLHRRIEQLIRWNAMAMVARANRRSPGIGGHVSSPASLLTLFEIGFNYFFQAPSESGPGDLVYLHGHSTPAVYARAFLEGRLTEEDLDRFRQECPRETGLSSYPHPWLMPTFWQFPTVSMGLGPVQAIYQARFLRYLHNRGICDTSKSRVWCFLGDGEMDEPESLGAIGIASRERLDNLVFVINCNLQRLDGPVRGNGKIIQELERHFLGAGWKTIKVIWGGKWDPLLQRDHDGELARRMEETVDGQYQKYTVEPGRYFREHFFNSERLREMVADMRDDELEDLERDRGGLDPEKVYAAYRAACQPDGRPTVVIAKTIKGFGMGKAAEARNMTHKANRVADEDLPEFRDKLKIPIADDQLSDTPYFKPADDASEIEFLKRRREELGGFLPARRPGNARLEIPDLDAFANVLEATDDSTSTTQSFGRMLTTMLKDERIGKQIVPIIPDETRTFGLESLFATVGVYDSGGQKYESVDAGKILHYRETATGQLLEEGITEAGAMSSFIAAGTSYSNLDQPTIPFFLFYSMFGFQRVGDLIWAAADARAKGFLLGCTAGRTTLNGEGLQHQDGHSPLVATTIPNLVSYDPAYGYEAATIIHDGLRRMYVEDEQIFYYLTMYNEDYPMPAMPEGSREGILKGIYRVVDANVDGAVCPQLFGSGSILHETLRARDLLEEKFGIRSDVWSVTSFSQLRREAEAAERRSRLHPNKERRRSYLERCLKGRETSPFVAASDYVRMVPEQIARWIPGPYVTLGTDGFGRSDTRQALRDHFEISAEHIAYAALWGMSQTDAFDSNKLPDALVSLQIDPDKIDPAIC